MVALAQPERKETNKHRLALLVLLAGLEHQYKVLVQRHTAEMMGGLLRLADADGKIPTTRLNAVRMVIRSGMVLLASRVATDFNQAVIPAAHYGVELAGGGAGQYAEAQRSAADMIERGALGVAFVAVAANAIAQATNNFTGAVTRAIVSGEPLKTAQVEIDHAAEMLTKKISGQATLNLNAAFVAATRATAGSTNIARLVWRIFPALESHCVLCLSRDGNEYPIDDPVWDDLPAHNHCGCWGEPVEETP